MRIVGAFLLALGAGLASTPALAQVDRFSPQGEVKGVRQATARFAKPIDEMLLHEVFSKFKHVITVEDGCIQGGMGSAVLEFMADHGYSAQVKRLGIPDKWIEHGSQKELYAECGFDEVALIAAVKEMLPANDQRTVRVHEHPGHLPQHTPSGDRNACPGLDQPTIPE